MDKLEKHIKNRLDKREIRPSLDAWNRIEAELGEEKVDKKPKYWIGVAAAVIFLVTLSILFFANPTKVGSEEIMVDVEHKELKSSKTEIKIEEAVVVNSENQPIETKTTAGKPEKFKVELSGEEEKLVAIEKNTTETIQENHVGFKKGMPDVAEINSETIIANKLDEVLVLVNAMEQENKVVTDAEIDSLLLKAQHEILNQRIHQNSGEVNAMALLNEVELELYDEKQHPLFNKLKESFFVLRTAVADRNK